ncbi:MAG: hypothetical protein MZV63_66265 [Marinilabiliales bacterium]|nr:hypothetical protein [Marinilabiliales bacterium]
MSPRAEIVFERLAGQRRAQVRSSSRVRGSLTGFLLRGRRERDRRQEEPPLVLDDGRAQRGRPGRAGQASGRACRTRPGRRTAFSERGAGPDREQADRPSRARRRRGRPEDARPERSLRRPPGRPFRR